MRFSRIAVASSLVFCLLASAPRARGQSSGTTTGDLRGRVVDDKNVSLPGVTVSATNRDTGLSRQTVTKMDGDYVIPLLSPGVYQVKAEASLFNPALFDNVRVALGTTTSLDIPLNVATSAATVVEVTAETPLIDQTRTDLSSTVGRNKIELLPNIGRNFLSFALTTPRVSEDRGPQTGSAASSGFSINGQSPRYNNLAVDGFDNNDQATGSVRATFSQEAVQEYQVITNPYASEYGRTAGGVINIITRSGTNDFKGSVFVFYRSNALSAKDPLVDETIPLQDRRYGLSLGGPLVKDRVFFFGAFERQSTDTANPVTVSQADAALIRSKGFALETGNVPYGVKGDSVVLKTDIQIGASNTLTLRGNWSKGTDDNQLQWGGQTARSAGGTRDSRDTSGALGLTSVLGATSFNELRGLYSDSTYKVTSLDESGGVSVSLPGVATFGTQRFLPQPRDGKVTQIFDAFSLETGTTGHVRLKIGAEYDRFEQTGSLPNFFAGLYRFSALPSGTPGLPPQCTGSVQAAFACGIPAVFIQSFGDPSGAGTAQQIAGFIQGDFQVGPSILFRLGVRYDYEKPIAPFAADSNNFAPRLSFSWGPTESLRVKGGLGRFYGVGAIGPMFAASIQNGVQIRTQIRVLGVGPSSLSPAVPWSLPGHKFPTEAAAGVGVYPPFLLQVGNYESAYTDQASLGLELGLGRKLLISLDGVTARGRNILVSRNINPITNDPVAGARPDPTKTDVFLYESSGNSYYTAGTLGLVSRLGGPVEFSAYYTRADAEDDYIDWLTEFQPQDPLNPKAERGPSVMSPDQKATLSATFSSVRSTNFILKDWTLAAIVDWRNGIHYNVTAGVDLNRNGDPLSDRPPGVGRNSGNLGAQFTLDLRLARTFWFTKDVGIEVNATCTNVTDNENVVARQGVANLPSFGEPTLYGAGRIFQFGGRFNF
jgi:TonB dependent receptor/Carboxypeptidase regulatory-like domain/TonB-dependent Receptor Plug Domain